MMVFRRWHESLSHPFLRRLLQDLLKFDRTCGRAGINWEDPNQTPWHGVLAQIQQAESGSDAKEVKALALAKIPGMSAGIELSEPLIDLVSGTLGQLD